MVALDLTFRARLFLAVEMLIFPCKALRAADVLGLGLPAASPGI